MIASAPPVKAEDLHAPLDSEDAAKVLGTYALLRSKTGSSDYKNVTRMLEDVFS